MNASAVNLNVSSLEQTLMMESWGKWARHADIPRLGFKRQPWVQHMKTEYADEDLDAGIPDIDPDFAMLVDRSLAALNEYSRNLLVLYYQRKIGLNRIAKVLGKSRQRVSTDRDCALSALYGLMYGTALAERA